VDCRLISRKGRDLSTKWMGKWGFPGIFSEWKIPWTQSMVQWTKDDEGGGGSAERDCGRTGAF
jgi:hypothetical protein